MKANAPWTGLEPTARLPLGGRSRRQMLAATAGIILVVGPSFFGADAAPRPFAGRVAVAGEVTTRREPTRRPLPSVRATGVPTRPILLAAAAFFATLPPDQQARVAFPADEAAWLDQTSVEADYRHGMSLPAMSAPQHAAALALIRATLDSPGVAPTEGIVRLKEALDGREADGAGDRFALLGRPAMDEPWGWQLDCPQMLVTVFIAGDQVVVTPTALEPGPSRRLAAVSPR